MRFLIRLPPLSEAVREGEYRLGLQLYAGPYTGPRAMTSPPISTWMETTIRLVTATPEESRSLRELDVAGREWFAQGPSEMPADVSDRVRRAVEFDVFLRRIAHLEFESLARGLPPLSAAGQEFFGPELEAISYEVKLPTMTPEEKSTSRKRLTQIGLAWLGYKMERPLHQGIVRATQGQVKGAEWRRQRDQRDRLERSKRGR